MLFRQIPLALLLILAACGAKEDGLADLQTRAVTLPDGSQIRAEVMIDRLQMARGMMFRESVPRGTGMLFIHEQPGKYTYWMFQVKIPLDIIWMDTSHTIQEISADTPPCTTKASQCPQYGGHFDSMYVLELGAGEARRLNLRVGSTLGF